MSLVAGLSRAPRGIKSSDEVDTNLDLRPAESHYQVSATHPADSVTSRQAQLSIRMAPPLFKSPITASTRRDDKTLSSGR